MDRSVLTSMRSTEKPEDLLGLSLQEAFFLFLSGTNSKIGKVRRFTIVENKLGGRRRPATAC